MSTNTYHTQPKQSTPEQSNEARSSGSDLVRQILVIVALVATIFVNYLSNTLPINGRTPGEISDSFPVRFTPAGYVFSIWSIIYLGLIAYAIYQALPSQRTNPRLHAIAWLFILSCLANISWIFAWHYGFYPLSLLIMLVLLGSLILIYARLYPSYNLASAAERWTTHITFRIYLGWVTVATIANATIVLYDLGWQGAPLGADDWAAFLIFLGTLIGFFFALRLRDIAYTLVLVWAFVGIYVKQGDAPVTAYTALTMAGLLAGAAFLAFLFGRRTRESIAA